MSGADMDAKVCLWPGHPLFRLILQYTFDLSERYILYSITGVQIDESISIVSDYTAAEVAIHNDWLEGLKIFCAKACAKISEPMSEYSLLTTASRQGCLNCLEWLAHRCSTHYNLHFALNEAIAENQVQSMKILEKYGAEYGELSVQSAIDNNAEEALELAANGFSEKIGSAICLYEFHQSLPIGHKFRMIIWNAYLNAAKNAPPPLIFPDF